MAEIDGIITGISSSTHEQATGLQQVNTVMNQMDQVTQQNAAMVEESTAASHGLAKEATQLASLLDGFSLAEGTRKLSTVTREPALRVVAFRPEMNRVA